jgi:hypothetical protein
MKVKSDFTQGLEHILNNPQTNFVSNPSVFNEIYKASGMSITSMIRHVGKRSKSAKKDEKPNDDERSKERLGALEASSSSH